MMQDNAGFPRISAYVRADATGEVIIDGVSQIVVAVDDAGVREEIVAVATGVARDLDAPVRLEVEDEQGVWPLVIHPDGRVESTGDVISTTGPVGTHASTTELPDEPSRPSEPSKPSKPSESSEPSKLSKPSKPSKPSAETEGDPSFAQLMTPRPSAPTDGLAPRPSNRSVGLDATPSPVFDFPPTLTPARARAYTPPYEPTETEDSSASGVAFISSLIEKSSAPKPQGDSRAERAERSGAHVPPNLADFLSTRPPAPAGPALQGWQGAIRRLTGGFISVSPSSRELAQRNAISAVQRSLSGPRTIVVLNPKGGAHKTTATLMIAATFGIYRGGYTLAWDNNETMGTLGVRAQSARHTNTAVDLLRDLDRFSDVRSARVGDLDNYVRNQGDAQFDALASDLDPAGAASIDAVAFRKLHATLSRFYRVLVIDTGNNMRASNWEAAVDTADQLVVVSTIREDTGYGAASLLDGLRRKGHADKVAQAVTILASPSKTVDQQLSARLHEHFGQLTREVLDVPYDPSLVGGGPLNVDTLAPRTRAAWLQATAAIAEGL